MNVISCTEDRVVCQKDGKQFNLQRSLAQIYCLLREAAIWFDCATAYVVCVFNVSEGVTAPHDVCAFVCATPLDATSVITLPGWMTCAVAARICLSFDETVCISKGQKKNATLNRAVHLHTEGIRAEARVSADIQTRLDLLQQDSQQAAENINGYETLDGYTKLRVKRAFTCLNEYTIENRLREISVVIPGLEGMLSHHTALEGTFEVPDEAHVGDMYSPSKIDYSL